VEKVITEYIKNQGQKIERYEKIYDDTQLELFESM